MSIILVVLFSGCLPYARLEGRWMHPQDQNQYAGQFTQDPIFMSDCELFLPQYKGFPYVIGRGFMQLVKQGQDYHEIPVLSVWCRNKPQQPVQMYCPLGSELILMFGAINGYKKERVRYEFSRYPQSTDRQGIYEFEIHLFLPLNFPGKVYIGKSCKHSGSNQPWNFVT